MVRVFLPLAAVALVLSVPAVAQRGARNVRRVETLDEPQQLLPPPHGGVARPELLGAAARPTILITGYWPPTNEAVRRFSTNPARNPMGWIGADWEGRGYDVVSYFPEFNPPDCDQTCGRGTGAIEVDYQDTVRDWDRIVAEIRPIAIVTLSRGFTGFSWELEMNQFNRAAWIPDFRPPHQPTPVPPDPTVPAGHERNSSLPVEAIRDAILASGVGVVPFICFSQDGGGFLSEFIAYLGVWHKEQHDDPSDPDWCVAAGHIHVGANISWPVAEEAVQVSLRALIEHVDCVVDTALCRKVASYCPSAPNSSGSAASLSWSGDTSIAGNDLTLSASGLPVGRTGFFFYGRDRRVAPFGDGTRCMATPIHRLLTPVVIDSNGNAAQLLDFTQPPLSGGTTGVGLVSPGDTFAFQLWYTDPAAGGAGFNTSDALEVLFCP